MQKFRAEISRVEDGKTIHETRFFWSTLRSAEHNFRKLLISLSAVMQAGAYDFKSGRVIIEYPLSIK
jgi:hypothetical protein